MRSFWKPIVWIIGLQAVCLALGLWIHNRFVASSTEWAGCDESASQLIPHVGRFVDPLRVLSERHTSDGEFAREAKGALQGLAQDSGTAAFVADSRMQVIASSVPDDSEYSPGSQILFRKSPRSAEAKGVGFGVLHGTGHDTAAVTATLPNGRIAVVYAPGVPIAVTPDTLRAVQPAVSIIAFLWIGGLQSAVIYLIFFRVRSEYRHTEARTSDISQRRLTDLVRTRDAVIFGLAKLAESRDPETGQHLERIASFSVVLCSALRTNPRFRHKITSAFIRNIGISSALHDIGKVGIEDAVLLKPGSFNDEERRRMQEHTLIGGDCIQRIERRLAGSNFLEMAREIALYHHEHWNGKGYPTGIAGEEIPLAARIVAVVDVYDALSVRRIYKEAFPHEECVAIIREATGTQFDPEIVEAFLKAEKKFQKIAQKFLDRKPPRKNDDRFEVACERDNRLTPAEASTLASVMDDELEETSKEVVTSTSA